MKKIDSIHSFRLGHINNWCKQARQADTTKMIYSSQNISSLIYEMHMLRLLHLHMDNAVEYIMQQISILKVPVATFTIIYVCYAFRVFSLWQERIAGTRVKQSHPDSPSNKLPPDATR